MPLTLIYWLSPDLTARPALLHNCMEQQGGKAMASYRIVSADSHFVEPPNMWSERIDQRFRDHAPYTGKYKDREGEFFMCENIQPVAVAGFFGSGKSSEELPQHIKRGFDAAPGSVWNPAERLKEQDRDGVSSEVLYTSMGMLLFGLDDAELRAACFRAFNDWAAEYCSSNPKRLIGTGTVALEDIDAGVKELQRCANKGLRGALIWGAAPEDKPYSDSVYDPFWAAAQDLDMPLSLHILTGRRGPRFSRRHVLRGYMTLPQEIQLSFADLVLGGVFERFPRLKVVSAENDISWLPHFCYRIDHAYDRLRYFEQGTALPIKPSEYMKRQVWATFQFETENVGFTADKFGRDKLMWSSDYPHTDSPWPRSREFIENEIKSISDEDKRSICGDNVLRLYGVSLN
jgi:predicted TIM-barrel fold metal-dependent hydrolase